MPTPLLKASAVQAILTAIRAARDAALGYRDEAVDAAEAATGSASAAATAATTATTQAGEAAGSAGAAATAATTATTAAGAATDAAGEAGDAAGDATDAAGEATTAAERAVVGAVATLGLLETGGDVIMPLAAGGEVLLEDVVPVRTLHEQVGVSATAAALSETHARLSAERARRTAERVAGGLGAGGDVRALYGSTVDVWGTADRLDEDIVGAAETQDDGDGPYVILTGDATVAWEVAVDGAGSPLDGLTAFAIVASVDAEPEYCTLALTVELLGADGSTIRYVDGLGSAVPGDPVQTVAAEALPLLSATTEERASRVRLTLDALLPDVLPASAPAGGYTVTVRMAAAPYVRASLPEVTALALSALTSAAPVVSRVAGALATPFYGRTQYLITTSGDVTLPDGAPERTQIVVWHDAASGDVVIVAPAGQAVRAASGAATMTTRGQRRECVLYADVWYVG